MTRATRTSPKLVVAVAALLTCGAWQWEHPLPHASAIAARAEHDGRVIEVGVRGAILTPDGGRARVLASGVSHDLRAVVATETAWFVAGDGGTLLRSLDGRTFEARPTGTRASLVALAAAPGELVALADDGGLVRSTDGGDTFAVLAGLRGEQVRATAVAVAPRGIVVGTSRGMWRADAADGRFTQVTDEPIESLEVAAGGAVTAVARSRVVYPTQLICNSCVDAEYEVVAHYRSADTVRWKRRTVTDPARKPGGWGPPTAPPPPPTPPAGGWGGWSPGGLGAPVVSPGWPRQFAARPVPEVHLFAMAAAPGGRMFAVGAGGTVMVRDGAGAWQRRATPTGEGQRLEAVVALDDRRVVVVGDDGVVLQSTDGGDHFHHRAIDRVVDLTAVWGAGDVVVAAGRDVIARSTDGGATWSTVATELSTVEGLWSQGGELWAVGSGVHRSTDGGATWKEVHDGWYSAVWGDGRRLFVAGHEGRVAVTRDRGAHWKALTSGTTAHLRGLWGGGGELWAVGGDPSSGAVVRSTDGGRTWSDQAVPTRAPMFAVTGTAREVFVLGAGGAILRGEP